MGNENLVCFKAIIGAISPIPGADKIEQATMRGWNSIVSKGTHKEGDEVLVLTQDAVIPVLLSDKFSFTNYLKTKQGVNFVKTVKLKGVYSECIILSMADANRFIGSIPKDGDYQKALNIVKFEEEEKVIMIAGKRVRVDKANSNFQVYQKFPNAKNVPGLFTETDEVSITRKIHGSNARFGIVKKTKFSLLERVLMYVGLSFYVKEYEYLVGSHNVQKNRGSKGFYASDVWKHVSDTWEMADKLNAACRDYSLMGSGFTLYGEIYGPAVQKGYGYGIQGISVQFFDAVANGEYLTPEEFYDIARKLELPVVEQLYSGPFKQSIVDELLKQKILGSNTPHEGVVVKSKDRSKVAKFINPEYLVFNDKIGGTDFH